MLYVRRHAHTTVCHTLVNVAGLSVRIHFQGSLIFIHRSTSEHDGSIFTGPIVVKPRVEAMHYAGVDM